MEKIYNYCQEQIEAYGLLLKALTNQVKFAKEADIPPENPLYANILKEAADAKHQIVLYGALQFFISNNLEKYAADLQAELEKTGELKKVTPVTPKQKKEKGGE